MNASAVTLVGQWPLAVPLRALASARGIALLEAPSRAVRNVALLHWRCHDALRTMVLPDIVGIRRHLVRRAITALLQSVHPRPACMTGVVLAPGAGTCEPANNGPVDAVRLQPTTEFAAFDIEQVSVSLGVLEIQHTRCWVFALHLLGDDMQRAGLLPETTVQTLPSAVAANTATAVEFLRAKSLSPDWPGVHLLKLVPMAEDRCYAELICSDTDLLHDILDSVVQRSGGTKCVSA